jgi:hypothetical protein
MGHSLAVLVAAALLVGPEDLRAELARPLDGQRVREAIAYGRSASAEVDQYLLFQEASYVVNFDTPFLRVAQLAHAMKQQNTPLDEAAVSAKLTSEVVNVYVHARHEARAAGGFREVEQVVIARPREGGPPELVTPVFIQSFVRRVPVPDDYAGPTLLARSLKAVFPLSALVPGAEVRIRFVGGTTQVVKLQADRLAQVR